jgi:hypothetical protein
MLCVPWSSMVYVARSLQHTWIASSTVSYSAIVHRGLQFLAYMCVIVKCTMDLPNYTCNYLWNSSYPCCLVLCCRVCGVEVCQKVYKRACFVSDEQFSIIRQHVLLGNEMSYVTNKPRVLFPSNGYNALSSEHIGPLHATKQTDIRHYYSKIARVDFDK